MTALSEYTRKECNQDETNASSPFQRTSAKVTLTFKEDCDRVLLVKKKEKRILELENHTLNMDIGSGEGWFVVPIQ